MNDGASPNTNKQRQKQNIHEEYRQVLVSANKLEAIQSRLDSVIDLFVTPIVSNLFSKLCKDCIHLLLKCPFKLEEFRKAEDLVWRRVYHDVYRLLKTKRQLIKGHDEYLVESHFMSGIGFYSSLIVQLRCKYSISRVRGILAPLNLALIPVDNVFNDGCKTKFYDPINAPDKSMSLNEDERFGDKTCNEDLGPANQWAQQAIYRSLIYMGDLARYLLEFSDYDHRSLAFELYKSASRFQPDHGLPFNQLATLAGGSNNNLDAVCNYMRSCLRPKPFERAESNMIKIFELNKKHHEELGMKSYTTKVSEVLASKDPSREAEILMRATIVNFLKLASNLWFGVGNDLSADLQNTVVKETQKFFELLREAIELEPIFPFTSMNSLEIYFRPTSGGPCTHERPRYLSPTIMFEFCSISIMLITRRQIHSTSKDCLEKQSNMNCTISENITDLVNTLALNLLHYATSRCQKMIISKIQDLRISRLEQTTEKSILIKPPSETSLRNSSPISSASRRTLSRIRQRKAATNYSDEKSIQQNHVLIDDDSDLSELEETALSTIDALDISSEMSEGAECRADDLIDLGSGSDEGNLFASRALLSRPAIKPTRSQNYQLSHKTNLTMNETCNSLPTPDLLTGDIADISFRTNPTIYNGASCTPSEIGSELQLSTAQSITKSTLAYIYNQTYLPTIKILFDWLLSNGSLIESDLESFNNYQIELTSTVELLVEMTKLIELDDIANESEIYKHMYQKPEWSQKYPMSCDYPFVNLSPMKSVLDANINFDLNRELDDSESGFITIQCIMGFSHALTIFLRNKTLRS